MSEVDIDTQIRDLCQQILNEKDPDKVQELLSLFRNLVSAARDESQMRMRFIARHYRNQIRALSHVSERSARERVSHIPALLNFLGLKPQLKLRRE